MAGGSDTTCGTGFAGGNVILNDCADNALARAGAVLEIDLGAIAANWRLLRSELAPGVACAGVVKADGYGLGMVPVAQTLFAAGCRLFFVAHLDEGIALRAALPVAEIAVLNGLLPGTAAEFRRHGLIPVLNDLGQIAAWKAQSQGHAAILHVDTGMARLGLSARELQTLSVSPERLGGFQLRAIMSHLACADEPMSPKNAEQLRRFRAVREKLPPVPASLAASSGIFLGSNYHFDIVRPGVALYGVNPLPGYLNKMSQVVTLKAQIIQLRDVDRGESVGYGATYRMDRPGRIATLAVGYADGWMRSLSNRGCAYLDDHRLRIVGRVSMDLTTVDVTDVEPQRVAPGNVLELVGPHHDIDAVAAEADTIGYEILTALGSRYHRIYRGATA